MSFLATWPCHDAHCHRGIVVSQQTAAEPVTDPVLVAIDHVNPRRSAGEAFSRGSCSETKEQHKPEEKSFKMKRGSISCHFILLRFKTC